MRLTRRVPLAWLNLTHSTARFVLSILGITFAVILMLVQLGFWRALIDSQTAVLRKVEGDLFLVSATMSTITDTESFALDRVQQARSARGVAAARPLYVRSYPFIWKNRGESGQADEVPQWPIRVLAFTPDTVFPPFREREMPGFAAQQTRLRDPDTVLLDARSKPIYDAVRRWRDGGPPPIGVEREIGGRRLQIVGLFELGTDFTTDGNLLMSAGNMADLLGGARALESVQLGLISITSDTDARSVQRELRQIMPDDVRVLTRAELLDQEQTFWSESTPIGFIFMLGLAVGFVVGVVICYQVLATEVTDHLAEFATLKAIGYHDHYVSGVVIQEALILSLFGFAAGLAAGWPLYAALEDQTGLPLQITFARSGLILALTVGMCVLSGFMALRRVRSADPAEVFG